LPGAQSGGVRKGPIVTLNRHLLVALAVFAGLFCASCRDRSKPAQKQVVLYCSVDQAVAEPIVAAFEKDTGIKVLARYDTEASKTVGLVQKLRAEAGEPVCDVFWSSEVFYTIRLAGEGILAPFESERTRQWPEAFTGPQKRWRGLALRARVIAYHTRRVRPADAPKRLEDLLDPKWKGRIVMADPQFGTTGGDVASWFVHYGAKRAEEILRGLKANGVRLVDGNSTAVRMLVAGRADLCLTDTDDVYAAQRNGHAVALNYLDQGGKGVLTIPNTVSLVAGAPHGAEAGELIDFLLAGKAESMLAASDSHNSPVLESVAEKFRQYRIGNPLRVDYARVAEMLPAAKAKAAEILR